MNHDTGVIIAFDNTKFTLDTGDGVVIAYMGSPEDALFVALTIRDERFKR